MNRLTAIFSYFKGYIDKSLASNTAEDAAASEKIKTAFNIIFGK
jgi:hypothetical protein